jgi:hypothetical protein
LSPASRGRGIQPVILGNPLSNLVGVAFNGAVLGLVAGGSFAAILSIVERRRTLGQLSLWRIGLWGGIGGIALLLFFAPRLFGAEIPLHLVLTSYLVPLALNGLLGAGFATGSVALARRGDTKLIEGG